MTPNIQFEHRILMSDLDTLASPSTLTDLVADQRHLRRRYEKNRLLPFAAKLSIPLGRMVLLPLHPTRVPDQANRGICAGNDGIDPVGDRHNGFVVALNRDIRSQINERSPSGRANRELEWSDRTSFSPSEVAVLECLATKRQLVASGDFELPGLRAPDRVLEHEYEASSVMS